MSDLTQPQWREIQKAAVYLPQDGSRGLGRYIGLAELQKILRKSKRTNDQNALLWALYEQIIERGGEDMRGWDRADLHEFFLIDFFGSDRVEMFGRTKLKPKRRSSRLTKSEFSDYIEHIARFMAERGVVLDMPEAQAA